MVTKQKNLNNLGDRAAILIGSIWIPDSSPGYATKSSKRGLSRPLPRMRVLCTN